MGWVESTKLWSAQSVELHLIWGVNLRPFICSESGGVLPSRWTPVHGLLLSICRNLKHPETANAQRRSQHRPSVHHWSRRLCRGVQLPAGALRRAVEIRGQAQTEDALHRFGHPRVEPPLADSLTRAAGSWGGRVQRLPTLDPMVEKGTWAGQALRHWTTWGVATRCCGKRCFGAGFEKRGTPTVWRGLQFSKILSGHLADPWSTSKFTLGSGHGKTHQPHSCEQLHKPTTEKGKLSKKLLGRAITGYKPTLPRTKLRLRRAAFYRRLSVSRGLDYQAAPFLELLYCALGLHPPRNHPSFWPTPGCFGVFRVVSLRTDPWIHAHGKVDQFWPQAKVTTWQWPNAELPKYQGTFRWGSLCPSSTSN